MNILVITNSYPNKSKPYAGHHIKGHIELHRAAGLSVRVLHPGQSRSGIFYTSWKYLKLALLVMWTAVSQPFDLVHAHWVLPAGLFGVFAAALRRKPLVVTSHGAFTNTFNQRSRLIRFLVSFVLARADQIIAVGDEQQKKIEAIAHLPDNAVACINMGVLIPETAVTRQQARQQLKLPQDKHLVIFIGNLLKRKGPDILINAIARMEETNRPQVYIGGQGPEKETLAKQIETLALGNTIKLIGPVQPADVHTWLAAADICVVPSRTEPFGLVAVEALAAGTPVIAAEVGGLTETIHPNQNGLLFPIGDDKALAECLTRLLNNAALRESMSQKANSTVRKFDMRFQAEMVKDIYEELIV